MPTKMKPTPIRVIVPVLFLVYILIKLYGDPLVEHFYNSGQIDLLNKVTSSSALYPLSFYTGKIENLLWGPAKSLFTGVLFLILALKFLKTASPFKFGLAVFIYLLISRPEVLFYPPYGESITGPFSDAVWLVQHNLDYIGLLHQDTFAKYGPQIYPLSIYPLFLACLMWIFPTPVFLFVIHVLVFMMGAAIVSLIREALAKLLNAETALLGATLFLSFPLFQSMVELINLEIPNLFFALLAVYFLSRRNIKVAGAMATLSLLVKMPGFIISFLVFFVAMLFFVSEFFVSRGEQDRKKLIKDLLYGTATFLFAVMVGFVRNKMTGPQPINNKLSLLIGWPCLKSNIWFWTFLFLLAVWAGELIAFFVRHRQDKGKWQLFLQRYFLISLFYLTIMLWFFMYLNFSAIAYRYQFLMEGFVVVCLVYVLSLLLRSKAVMMSTLCVAIVFCFSFSHGLLYTLKNMQSYNPTELERSLEYRNYLKADRQTVKEMLEHYSDYTIGAPLGIAQALALPQLGYVQKPLDVRLYGMRATLGLKQFEGLRYLNPDKTVWIGYAFDEMKGGKIKFPFNPELDSLIKKIVVGNNEVLVFKGGIAIERARIMIELYRLGLNQTDLSKIDKGVLKKIIGISP
jgi:hypothetical protein